MLIFKLIALFITSTTLAFAVGITSLKQVYDGKEDPAIPSKVTIYSDQETGQNITKMFYGSHLDSGAPFPDVELIKELDLGRIRVGGNDYDVYNWKSSVSLVVGHRGVVKLHSYKTIAKKFKEYGVSGIYQINLTGYQPELRRSEYVLRRSFNSKEVAKLVHHLNGKLKLGITGLFSWERICSMA